MTYNGLALCEGVAFAWQVYVHNVSKGVRRILRDPQLTLIRLCVEVKPFMRFREASMARYKAWVSMLSRKWNWGELGKLTFILQTFASEWR